MPAAGTTSARKLAREKKERDLQMSEREGQIDTHTRDKTMGHTRADPISLVIDLKV